MGQRFLPALRLTPVSIIPTKLYTLLHLSNALIKRTGTGSLGTFPQTNALSDIGGGGGGGGFTEKWLNNGPIFRRSTASLHAGTASATLTPRGHFITE
jgi:hypothetical protein